MHRVSESKKNVAKNSKNVLTKINKQFIILIVPQK